MGLFSSLKHFGEKLEHGIEHQAKKFGHAMKGTYEEEWKQVKNTAKKFTHDPAGALGDVAKVGLDAAMFVTRPSSVLSNPTMMWQAHNIADKFGKEYTGHSLGGLVPQPGQSNQTQSQSQFSQQPSPNKNMRGVGRLFGTFMSGMSSSNQQAPAQEQSGGGFGSLIGGLMGGGGSGGPAVGLVKKAKGLFGKIGGLFKKHKKHVKKKISAYKRRGQDIYNRAYNNYRAMEQQAQNAYYNAMDNVQNYAQQFDAALADPYPSEYPHFMGTDLASRSPHAVYGVYGNSPAALMGADPATYGPPL